MEIAIKKVGKRDNHERFVIVRVPSREVITVRDVTEGALWRFFQKRGVTRAAFDRCLERARQRYAESTRSPAAPPAKVDDNAETKSGDDLLFQLGLDDETSVH